MMTSMRQNVWIQTMVTSEDSKLPTVVEEAHNNSPQTYCKTMFKMPQLALQLSVHSIHQEQSFGALSPMRT